MFPDLAVELNSAAGALIRACNEKLKKFLFNERMEGIHVAKFQDIPYKRFRHILYTFYVCGKS